MRFLPPESFLEKYNLLIYLIYLADIPDPEVRTEGKHWLRRGGAKIPVRNYEAYRLMRSIDKVLYDQARRMEKYFNGLGAE